jgi:lysophospholipase L1-like esterase
MAIAPAARAGRIVALGDSLTAGYYIGADHAFPAVLQARLDAAGYEYSVVNAGVSGDTSAHAAQRVTSALAGDIRILIAAVGVNDGLRRYPVKDLTSNLSRIIEAAQSRSAAVILCGMEAPPIYGSLYAASFHRAYEPRAAVSRAARAVRDAAGSRKSKPCSLGPHSSQCRRRSCDCRSDLAVSSAAAASNCVTARNLVKFGRAGLDAAPPHLLL